jgi:hypothetical protein
MPKGSLLPKVLYFLTVKENHSGTGGRQFCRCGLVRLRFCGDGLFWSAAARRRGLFWIAAAEGARCLHATPRAAMPLGFPRSGARRTLGSRETPSVSNCRRQNLQATDPRFQAAFPVGPAPRKPKAASPGALIRHRAPSAAALQKKAEPSSELPLPPHSKKTWQSCSSLIAFLLFRRSR